MAAADVGTRGLGAGGAARLGAGSVQGLFRNCVHVRWYGVVYATEGAAVAVVGRGSAK